MSARHIARCPCCCGGDNFGAAERTAVPSAFAQPCPDVEVVFARGTDEPPGVGGIGQEFVDSMRSQVHRRSVGVYAVNYPASTDFPAPSTVLTTPAAHVQSMAANCPNTRMVLGGFSQGAAVIGFVTADVVPDGAPASAVTGPMPARGGGPRRRGRPLRKTVERVYAHDRRAAYCNRSAVCSQDHRVVRP